MSQATLFELPAETPFTVKAVCHLCGAESEPIVQQHEFDKPHLWAIVALNAHMRDAHPGESRWAA